MVKNVQLVMLGNYNSCEKTLIDTSKPMVEQLINYPYSSFPLYCSEDSAPKA